MEQKLWGVALILLLLKTKWDFFHGGTEGDGTLEGNSITDTSLIKLSILYLILSWKPQEILVPLASPEAHLYK